MKNQEIADIFNQIADILEFKGDNRFRVNAYRKAYRVISELPTDIEAVAKEDKLQDIPGIGEDLAQKIREYLATGRMQKLAEVKAGIPDTIFDLRRIPGLGPRTLALAYQQLKVTDLDSLKKAIADGSLAQLPSLGEKKVENIARGIALMSKLEGRMLLGTALPIADAIVAELQKNKAIKDISPAGSLRRRCETIGDIDILAASRPGGTAEVINYFVHLPMVQQVLGAGETKASIITNDGHQVDLRVVEPSSYGAALQYFTGSKAHNVRVRSMAKDKGLKINEYGVYKGSRLVAGRTEADVYKAIGLPLMPPEIREDRGEIEAAQQNKLPDLIDYNDLRGDLHCHTFYSDGKSAVEDLARAGQQAGYEYLLITDHSAFAAYAHGLSRERLLQQWAEIDRVNKKIKGLRLLKGTEVDILADGNIDWPEDILKQLDLVVASIHSGFKNKVTERIMKAMENPHVDIIAHPTGRLISTREGYADLDLERIFKKAVETETLMEINSFPDRLDLNDVNCRRARELGVKFSIGTDSHRTEMLGFARLGIATARRGWLNKTDVFNTRPLAKLI